MVDISRVQFALRKLIRPESAALGQEGFYKALKEQVQIFEQDKDFKKILGKQPKK